MVLPTLSLTCPVTPELRVTVILALLPTSMLGASIEISGVDLTNVKLIVVLIPLQEAVRAPPAMSVNV